MSTCANPLHLLYAAIVIKHNKCQKPTYGNHCFCALRWAMPVWADVAVGLYCVEQTLTRVGIVCVNVPMLSTSWSDSRLMHQITQVFGRKNLDAHRTATLPLPSAATICLTAVSGENSLAYRVLHRSL